VDETGSELCSTAGCRTSGIDRSLFAKRTLVTETSWLAAMTRKRNFKLQFTLMLRTDNVL